MTKRVCSEPGCPSTQSEPRCLTHRRQREQQRGSRQQRGYGADHDALRAQYQRRMNRGEAFDCWRCGAVIVPHAWTLGHCDLDRTEYHGPECPPCDYATAGRTRCPHRSHN